MLNLQWPYFSCVDRTTNNTSYLQHRQTYEMGFREFSHGGWGTGGRQWRKMTPVFEYLKVKSSLHWFTYKHLAFSDIQRFHSPVWRQEVRYSGRESAVLFWMCFRGALFTWWAPSVRPTGSRRSWPTASPPPASVSCESHLSGRCCPGHKGCSGRPHPSLHACPVRWREHGNVTSEYLQKVQCVCIVLSKWYILLRRKWHAAKCTACSVSSPGPVWTQGALCAGSSRCFPPGQPQTYQWPRKCSPSAWLLHRLCSPHTVRKQLKVRIYRLYGLKRESQSVCLGV